MTHHLKCWPEPFRAIDAGAKTHEIRFDDRGYRVGDVLVLEEWVPQGSVEMAGPIAGEYTGKSVRREVSYITRGPAWGVPEGHVVMSLAALDQLDEAA